MKKIKIKEHQIIEKEIEVNFPYYYKHDLLSDFGESVIYGKIVSEDLEFSIQESESDLGFMTYEIEESKMSHSYFGKKYKCSKEEFEEVKNRALRFFKKL